MDRANIVDGMDREILNEVKLKMVRLGLRCKGERTWSANHIEILTAELLL